MSNQRSRTFRLSFIRRRIVSLCQSRALRSALLAALNGGPDAALVVEMIERVRPPTRLPMQVVTPVPQQEEEETSEEEPVTPAQQGSPPRQERPNPHLRRTETLGDTVIIIEDSDSDRD